MNTRASLNVAMSLLDEEITYNMRIWQCDIYLFIKTIHFSNRCFSCECLIAVHICTALFVDKNVVFLIQLFADRNKRLSAIIGDYLPLLSLISAYIRLFSAINAYKRFYSDNSAL